MLCFIDEKNDPYFNLAEEEYLLTNFNEGIFRLWRNSPSIIVGRNQNTLAEINRSYVEKHDIPVVRRLSGGGAVFHDLGNVNFTFIQNYCNDGSSSTDSAQMAKTSEMFRKFTEPIILALKNLGINAYLEGRNDLLIDGKKFSGNAICVQNGRILQHGTLLFSASITNLSDALISHPEKFVGKKVSSNISRVTNISSHLSKEMTVEEFIIYLKDFIHEKLNLRIAELSKTDIDNINQLRKEKYHTYEWNYGKSPKYEYLTKFKLTGGSVEVNINVDNGLISACKIQGDFFTLHSVDEIEKALIGLAHDDEKIKEVLKRFI
ncbi:MAG: lipoate--protein ligase [Bacteroidales bacterium]